MGAFFNEVAMKVIAKKNGYIHGEYKRVGVEFECSKEEFSKHWMVEDIKDVPKPLDNSNVKKAEDVKMDRLEIPDFMDEYKKDDKKEADKKEKPKKKPAKKTTKKAD